LRTAVGFAIAVLMSVPAVAAERWEGIWRRARYCLAGNAEKEGDMDDDIASELARLRQSVDKQTEIMRGLVGSLQETGQVFAKLVERLSKRDAVGEADDHE
jgi:hypothetical protein